MRWSDYIPFVLMALAIAFIPVAVGATPIFPPMIDGTATVTIETRPLELDVDGITMRPPVRSVALINGDGAQVACVQMADGESKPVQYTIENNASGRVSVVAQAYTVDNCTGMTSPPSNTAYYFFFPPSAPVLSE
jgi:hypothetical protein